MNLVALFKFWFHIKNKLELKVMKKNKKQDKGKHYIYPTNLILYT